MGDFIDYLEGGGAAKKEDEYEMKTETMSNQAESVMATNRDSMLGGMQKENKLIRDGLSTVGN